MSRGHARRRWRGLKIGIALALLIASSCAGRGERSAERPPRSIATSIFHLAGVDDHVRVLADEVVRAASMRAAALAPEAARELEDSARAAAAEPRMQAAAQELFAERSANRVLLEAAEHFLGSDPGRRLRALEVQADAQLSEQALSSFVDEIIAAPVPIDRVRLLERLVVATRGPRIAAANEAIAARVIARAVARREGATNDALTVELEQIDRQRIQTAASLRAQSTILMQFVYRDATDPELAAYVDFAESPAGVWLVDATQWTLAELEPWLDARMGAPPGGS